MNTAALKEKIIAFTVESVEAFLIKYPDLQFYAFAYDCNAEYAEINLSFNTETDFAKTLLTYQQKYPNTYQAQEDIQSLKYNSSDWTYLCFESIYIFSDEELTEIFQSLPEDDYKSWHEFVESLMRLFCECLIDFTKSETFKKIPKTSDFKCICSNHDESVEDTQKRMEEVKSKIYEI
jgi:hypothetical protein